MASSIPEPTRSLEVARLELTRLAAEMSFDQVVRRVCEISADALQVERVGVWLFIDNDQALRCVNLFERTKQEHSSGAILRVQDFPTYFSSLTLRKAIPAEIATSEPWTAELANAYLRPLGITSMLDAGIFVDNKLLGVVCHENVGKLREWTTEARDYVGSVADLLALRIQSAKVRELQAAFLTHEDRLANQDKVASLEQLAAGVADDFKNLLNVILNLADTLNTRLDLPDEVKVDCEEIATAAQQGLDLANELLDFARPGFQPPSAQHLAVLTVEFLPLLHSAVGPNYTVHAEQTGGAMGQVLIDKAHYLRILMNLVMNAREAMPNGGRIVIRLRSVRLTGNSSYTGRYIMLEVIDQGTGIDAAIRPHIFDPYFTTKSEGTGLGLATVRQMVERAGGMIQVESKPQQGTTFRIFFPSIGSSTGETGIFEVPPELRDD